MDLNFSFLDLLLFGYSVVYIFIVVGGGVDLFFVFVFGVVFYFFLCLGGLLLYWYFVYFRNNLKVR